MIAHRISSLREVAEVARHEGRLSGPLRDFLDGFYAEPSAEKLQDEPSLLHEALKDNGVADAYLAAVSDHLCRQYRLPRPPWIKSPLRVLKTPYFAAKTHGLRMIYLQESPTAFKQRNIFVSANALSRA
jgi:hypothetical protein